MIIPVYNDPDGIRNTLDCLVEQSLKNESYNILVVDNNSTDETAAVIRAFEDDYNNVHYLLEDEFQSSYAARNRGICQSQTPLLAFIDSDMIVEPEWLENGIRAMGDETSYLAYNVELYSTSTSETLVEKYDRVTGFPMEKYIDEMNFAGAGSIFVRRIVFEDIGLFDPRFVSGGDFEFGNRVFDADYEQRFTDEISARHEVRDTMRSQILKDIRVGRGICQRQVYYPDRFGKAGIPPLPSGIKSAEAITEGTEQNKRMDLRAAERLLFAIISIILVLARTYGYFKEYLYGEVISQPPMSCEEWD